MTSHAAREWQTLEPRSCETLMLCRLLYRKLPLVGARGGQVCLGGKEGQAAWGGGASGSTAGPLPLKQLGYKGRDMTELGVLAAAGRGRCRWEAGVWSGWDWQHSGQGGVFQAARPVGLLGGAGRGVSTGGGPRRKRAGLRRASLWARGVQGTLGHLRGSWGEGCRVHVWRLKDPSIGNLSKEAWGLGSSVRGALPLWKGDSPWSEVFRLRGLVTGLLVAGPKWPPLSLCVNRT